MSKMVVDVPSYIRTYGAREFFAKSDKDQNELLYKAFPLGKNSTLRAAKMRFRQKLKKKSDTPRVAKKKTVRRSVRNTPQTDQFSSLNTSPATPSNGGVATLEMNPYIKEILDIQKGFVYSKLPCSVKDAIELREQAQKMTGLKDIPPWSLPPMITAKENKQLYSYNGEPTESQKGMTKQELIINAICDPSVEIVAVEAAKRHGKSTAGFVGVNQGVWEGVFKKVGLWASGEDNAIGILGDVFTDEISVKQTYPLFKGQGSSKQKVFYNNAVIKAFSNNAAHTSGLDFDLCWIDEAHEVVVEHPEVFDMIIMTMRAKPSIKLLITMNKGTGTYHIFRDTLEKEFGREVRFFTIEDQDISHITAKADAKVRKLVKAVGGQGEVNRWLDNKVSNYGTFDQQSVRDAYDTYASWMMQNPEPYYTVMSFDPSGSGHPMGWSVWACDKHGLNFWTLDGGELQLGDSIAEIRNGEKLTPEQIRIYLKEKAYTYLHHQPKDQTYFISESNMNGKEIKLEMALEGYKARNQNFSTDKNQKKGASRGTMCLLARSIMDARAMFINILLLRNEWLIYNPDAHEKTSKFKGDIADSGIQAIYRLCKMSHSPYLSKKKIKFNLVEAPHDEHY